MRLQQLQTNRVKGTTLPVNDNLTTRSRKNSVKWERSESYFLWCYENYAFDDMNASNDTYRGSHFKARLLADPS